MSRRDRIDPETARLVEERLQWLLQEHGPESSPPQLVTGEDPVVAGEDVPLAGEDTVVARDAPLGAAADPAGPRRPHRRADRRLPSAPPPDPPVRSRAGARGARLPDGDRRPRLPEGRPVGPALLAGLAGFRRPHLVVVATILVLGVLVAGWAVLRARPVAVAVTPPPSVGPVSAAPPAPAPPSAAPSAGASVPGVVVHVLGAVRRPGLVTLAGGARVQDAIEAAGGLTGKADPGELNLAQAVTDGQQIVVGTEDAPAGEVRDGGGAGGGGGGGAGGTGAGGSGSPVNLNTASPAELEELPGVGPVMAGKIVAWRTENGRFSRIEELQEVDGVGPKTYAKLAPLCRV